MSHSRRVFSRLCPCRALIARSLHGLLHAWVTPRQASAAFLLHMWYLCCLSVGQQIRSWHMQEANAAKSVATQLRSFQGDMQKDGASQRAECRRLVDGAVRRADALVDETLQVSLPPCQTLLLCAEPPWREHVKTLSHPLTRQHSASECCAAGLVLRTLTGGCCL